MIGQKFNYLTVLEKNNNSVVAGTYWICQCDCGTIKSIRKHDVLNGHIKSCGCKKGELIKIKHTLFTNTSFFQKESDALSYFIGFLISDGYISNQKSIGIQLHEQDKDILEKFSMLIYNKNKLQYIIKNKSDYNRANQYRLIFTNETVFNILSNMGIDKNKTITAKVPEQYKFNSHFWRGMIDGDGTICITNNNFLVELVGTPSVITSFKEYCEYLNLVKNRQILYPKNYNVPFSTFRLNGKKAIMLCEEIYKNKEDLFLPRKYIKFQNWINK